MWLAVFWRLGAEHRTIDGASQRLLPHAAGSRRGENLSTNETIESKDSMAKGGQTPGREIAGKVTVAQVEEIAGQKMKDLNAIDLKGAVEMVRGSARSMGLEVVES